MTKNLARSKVEYSFSDWIPVLLPKEALEGLLKESNEAKGKDKSYLAALNALQGGFKKARLFEGMTEEQIMKKLHKTRKKIWREKYAKYYPNIGQ